ncbi:chemotaxis protein MotB [Bdellovibrio bacteriovorus]|uniref:Chemotaxis protein MotB n=1 Tax=Bdellovibrio bacteriovorus TaxID=959 RepID=A0A150WR47_BDEBC|nr:flagellar motor protein MotB [Bdellovibrio bacteriovorus]KYG66858.1 chemotaxis protein MotB [Bdellovibrio bacteriovorus]
MSRKHKKHEEHENHERWLVSYADFITLLFAFFVVMYATSSANEEKQKQFEDSIKMELRLSGGGGNTNRTAIEETMLELKMPLGSFPAKGGSGEAQDYVERSLNKSMGSDEKKNSIQDVYSDAVGVRIALAASTFFPAGSAKLKMSALGALDKVAEVLKSNNKRVIVEGHTDDTPIEGSIYPSNWELAAGRSSAVIRYFVKYHSIDAKRFISLSYGDQKPIVPNDTEEHRSMNRRIEVFIITDDKKAEI